MLPDFPRLTRHAPAWFQISRDSQTLTCMLRSPCQTHLTLSCVLPDSPGITDTLLQVSKLYRLNCASRSMLLQVLLGPDLAEDPAEDGKRFHALDVACSIAEQLVSNG